MYTEFNDIAHYAFLSDMGEISNKEKPHHEQKQTRPRPDRTGSPDNP